VTETHKAGGKWIYICSKVKLFAAKNQRAQKAYFKKLIIWLVFLFLSKHDA
jgi:hypothetical protein